MRDGTRATDKIDLAMEIIINLTYAGLDWALLTVYKSRLAPIAWKGGT
jgi:hypothetical protein